MNNVPQEHRTRLLSDKGPGNISRSFGGYLRLVGIRHIRGSPFHPQTKGRLERFHQANKLDERLDVYQRSYTRVIEEANCEYNAAQGVCAKRQVFELIQNTADQLIEREPGSVELLLTRHASYRANGGAP